MQLDMNGEPTSGSLSENIFCVKNNSFNRFLI